jgi:hypothetical protein
VEDILGEHGFQLSVLSDTRKTVEMGKILNARYLVRPTVIPLASDLFLEARIIDTNTGKMLTSAEVKIKGDLGDAYEKLGSFAKKLTDGVSESLTAQDEFVAEAGVITKYNGKGGAVVIPSGIKGQEVTGIKGNVFYGKNLTSLTLPDSLTVIGDYAFAYNQLTHVTIPYGVTSIGKYAFANNRLTGLYIPGSVSMGSIHEKELDNPLFRQLWIHVIPMAKAV